MSVDDIIHCKNEVSDIRNLTDEQNLLAAILYETHLSLTLGKIFEIRQRIPLNYFITP